MISVHITDNNNSYFWYQQFKIKDISNYLLISGIQILLSRIHCWYQQFICWYQQWNSLYEEFEFLIITIGVVDIKNYSYCDTDLLISVIQFLDISNNNRWYQQIAILISGMCAHCRYQQFVFLISTIKITDNCWYQEFEFLISAIGINVNFACHTIRQAVLW